jgi:hypothetical protein
LCLIEGQTVKHATLIYRRLQIAARATVAVTKEVEGLAGIDHLFLRIGLTETGDRGRVAKAA